MNTTDVRVAFDAACRFLVSSGLGALDNFLLQSVEFNYTLLGPHNPGCPSPPPEGKWQFVFRWRKPSDRDVIVMVDDRTREAGFLMHH